MIPEAPYDLDALAAILAADHAANPSHYAFVITAEGAIWQGAQMPDVGEADTFGHRHKANVGEALADELQARTGIETVASELTYDLRSGEPDSLDSMVATTFANVAMDLVRTGSPAAWWRSRTASTPTRTLPDPALGPRRVDVAVMYNADPLPAALRGQARRPDAAGRPRLRGPSSWPAAQSSRPDSARIARARADMSSSRVAPAMRPVSSCAASALTGSAAPELRRRGRGRCRGPCGGARP